MKEYTATITITVSLRARNEEQAQERAQLIADACPGKVSGRFQFDMDGAPEVAVEEN